MEQATLKADTPNDIAARVAAARKVYPKAREFSFELRDGRWVCRPIYGGRKAKVRIQQENLKRRLQLIEKF